MNLSKYAFKKVFPCTRGSFSASSDAEKWLRERGFGIGTMQSPEPRAITKGAGYLPKWKHYSSQEREELDGVATATDWRDGDVTVYLLTDPGDP